MSVHPWPTDDDIGCPVCGSEMCDDPMHVPPFPSTLTTEQAIARALDRLRTRHEAQRRFDSEQRGPLLLPEMHTLRDWLEMPLPPLKWRLAGWQPAESRILLAAPHKTGKTTLISNYLRCLADGDEWLGVHLVTPPEGRIALLDAEMGKPQLRDWLQAQHMHRDDKVLPVSMRGRLASFNILDPVIRGAWAQRLRDSAVEVVVLDCLRPFLDALGLNEHHEAGTFLVAFDALLHEAHVADALVVHHMGHQNERARGDSRILDWPDAIWTLVQGDQPGSPRYLKAYGRDVDMPESQLAYNTKTRRLTLVGGSRATAKATAALAAIIEVLTDATEALSGRAIKKALVESDHGRNAIDAALKLGVQTHQLEQSTGPKNAKLYASVPVSQSVPAVSPGHGEE